MCLGREPIEVSRSLNIAGSPMGYHYMDFTYVHKHHFPALHNTEAGAQVIMREFDPETEKSIKVDTIGSIDVYETGVKMSYRLEEPDGENPFEAILLKKF